MKILIAEYSDLEEILKLQKRAFISQAILYNDYSLPPLLQTIEEIQMDFNNKTFLKVLFSNKIIGSVRAGVNDNTCHIEKLMTDPGYRNRGIGKSLLLDIEKQFDNVFSFELFTGFKSRGSISLYESLEYKEVGRSMLNENIELVHMRKEIL